VLEVDTPRQFVRNLDVPTRITVDRRALTEKAARSIQGVETVVADDDGLVLHTKSPAQVLARLAALSALDGLQVRGATLEDVFLSLTGREYRE
jgi:ABC-2 type transport system ATP-binding protein